MEEDEELSGFLRGQTVRAVNVVDLEEGFEKEVCAYGLRGLLQPVGGCSDGQSCLGG
jgi:hypothetical protein